MRSSRLLLGMAALLAVAIVFSAATMAGAQKRGGTLRVAYGNEILGLDFHTLPGYEMLWVASNVGCGLLSLTPDGKFVPDAAESWTISPDGLLYTFKLRKDVLFHDGTRVDASVVKFTIDRHLDPATRSSIRTFLAPVHAVELIDPWSPSTSSPRPPPTCAYSSSLSSLPTIADASFTSHTLRPRRHHEASAHGPGLHWPPSPG